MGRVQEHLEAIYALESGLRAGDFLVDEPTAKALGATGRSREELLVVEGEGELEVALFLSAELLQRVAAYEARPLAQLSSEDLAGYCEVAEGVSHFLYLFHAAQNARRLSLLELEAQAEVDKFASCALAHWDSGDAAARKLYEQLFERVSYLPTLTETERWRYQEANRLAAGYCRRLLRLIAARRMDRLLADLRHCYRLGAEAKLRYLSGG